MKFFIFYAVIFILACVCVACDSSPISKDNPKYYYNDSQMIALFSAIEKSDMKALKKLIDSGVDINLQGTEGMYPLMWALFRGEKSPFKYLLEKGADPHLATDTGSTTVHWAAQAKDSWYLRTLLKYGANPDVMNEVRKVEPTPVFRALISLRKQNIQILIGAGANLNVQDSHGETVLVRASGTNQFDIVYELLLAGADYTIKNNWGHTLVKPIENNNISPELEHYQWRQKVIEFLRERGVEVNPKIK